MEDKIKNIFESTKKVKLEKGKKDSIRGAVLMFMKENPLSSVKTSKIGFWNILFLPKLKPVYIVSSSLALALLIVGAVSTQAQMSLPGDPLYPVKVGVNERVLQVLAFSDEAKIKLSLQLADARLQEAEKLVVEGKITENNRAQIDVNFNAHADAVAKSIDRLNNAKNYSAAEKVASDFEASLKAHSQVLEKIREIKGLATAAPKAAMSEDINNLEIKKTERNKMEDSIDSLINKVDSQATKASDSNAMSANSSLRAAGSVLSAKEKIAQNRLEAAQESIDEVKNLIKTQKDKIGEDAVNQVQENINLAEQKISEGKDKINGDNKDFTEAILLFNQANVIAKQSKNLLKAKNNLGLNIDIRINEKESIDREP